MFHVKFYLPISVIAIFAQCLANANDYLVAVPNATAADPAWSKAADALVAKHGGERVNWSGKPEELLPLLKEHKPRWLAIVGKPETFNPAYVRAMNRVSRKIDSDPWSDVRWGLVSGREASDVQRIAAIRDPLVIERSLCTTGIDMSLVKSGLTISDGSNGNWSEKRADGTTISGKSDSNSEPEGTISKFTTAWNEQKPQLVVSSSHATQFNLEMPFGSGLIASYDGKFYTLSKDQLQPFAKFLGGAMFTGDARKMGEWMNEIKATTLEPQFETPKVWVAAGNCLIGDAHRSSDSMVITALSSGGFCQFLGYVVPTWYGRGGWGALELWQANRGELSLADAHFLNHNRVIDDTLRKFPQAMDLQFDGDDIETAMKDPNFVKPLDKLQKEGVEISKDFIGLLHDRDVVVLWGDPKWDVTFRPEKGRGFSTKWSKDQNGIQSLTIESPTDCEVELATFFPERVNAPSLVGPSTDDVVLDDDFVIFRKLKLTAKMPITYRIVSK